MKTLFLGGSFSVNTYAQKYNISQPVLIHTLTQLLSYHNETPVYVMDDAEEVYGTDLDKIIYQAKELNYEITYLSYETPFPMDT